jgi:oligopeptide transport system substrate-binding protein
MPRNLLTLLLFLALSALITGCGSRETAVQSGNRHQILHISVGAEPEELDPHIVTSVAASDVLRALLEGLVSEDPRDLTPVPGVAERWEISEDGLEYTFHLRPDARWSNGDPVTAADFAFSYQRILSPALGAQYAEMLYIIDGARAFHEGASADFATVGVEARDERTLVIRLAHPTPYFLSLLNHFSWWPVHPPTITRHGRMDQRATGWTRAGNFVGNGPFQLTEWRSGRAIGATRNPHYWDADSVRLNEIRFHGIESPDTEERAFRSGQIHATKNIPPGRIDNYLKNQPEVIRSEPYLGVYYFRLNVQQDAFRDARVRQALSLAIDREALIRTVMHGHVDPAFFFTPPDTAGYTSETRVAFDPERARTLLAEAGFPNGQGLPPLDLLFNTQEVHRRIAEAVQQMWRSHLNVHVTLYNQEWQVYLSSVRAMNYQIARAAWIADYVDPSTFLDMWVTGGGNNNTGWSNAEYDDLIRQAAETQDPSQRLQHFQAAEAILLEEMPIIPIYHYRANYLLHPAVRGWHGNILNRHPFQHIYLESPAD